MCKDERVQRRVIADAKDRADEVYAVYEMDGRRDLTTIIEVRGHEGTSYDVRRDGATEERRRVQRLVNRTFAALARSFDIDRRTSRLVAC